MAGRSVAGKAHRALAGLMLSVLFPLTAIASYEEYTQVASIQSTTKATSDSGSSVAGEGGVISTGSSSATSKVRVEGGEVDTVVSVEVSAGGTTTKRAFVSTTSQNVHVDVRVEAGVDGASTTLALETAVPETSGERVTKKLGSLFVRLSSLLRAFFSW